MNVGAVDALDAGDTEIRITLGFPCRYSLSLFFSFLLALTRLCELDLRTITLAKTMALALIVRENEGKGYIKWVGSILLTKILVRRDAVHV